MIQDGPTAGLELEQAGLVRGVKYDVATGEPVGEFVYIIDAVPEPPEPSDQFSVNGLVDLLALDDNSTLLALEWVFAVGKGHTVSFTRSACKGRSMLPAGSR